MGGAKKNKEIKKNVRQVKFIL